MILKDVIPKHSMPSAKSQTLPYFTDFTTIALLRHPMEIEATAPVFESSPSAKPPLSTMATVNNSSNFRFKIDSASQDFLYAMLDLYPQR